MKEKVKKLTDLGYFVWEIAKILNISEYEVVKLQGKA